MVIDAWSRNFVELLSRLVCQLTISLRTLLCMTFHVIRPSRNTKILRVWKLFCSSRGNSRFKHGSVIVHSVFAYFTLSLSSAQVYMIKERCWFSQIDFFIEYFPHRTQGSTRFAEGLRHPCTRSRTEVEAHLRRFSNVLDVCNHVLGIQRTSCTRPDSESVSDSAFCITI